MHVSLLHFIQHFFDAKKTVTVRSNSHETCDEAEEAENGKKF